MFCPILSQLGLGGCSCYDVKHTLNAGFVKFPCMTTTDRGRFGEEVASQALSASGYQIVERNWRCPVGELDLVARDGDTWVFVEVRLRTGDSHGTPEESITHSKQTRLLNAAQVYLSEHALTDVAWRIDMVAITLAPSGKVHRLSLYRNAVRADD